MAYRIMYEDHTVCWVNNVLASQYGEHIRNVDVKEDADNGKIVSLGDWIELDRYEEADYSGDFEGKIRGQSPRGHWYIEVTKPEDAWLIYQDPIIEAEFNKRIKQESNFFHEKGSTVRAYKLSKHDIIEISELGFDGTPEKDKTVTVSTGANQGKFKVGA